MTGRALSAAALVAVLAAPVTGVSTAAESARSATHGWSVVPAPSPGTAQNTLFGVTTMPHGGVWAVGDRVSQQASRFIAPLVEHRAGATWTATVLPGKQTNLIAAYSPAHDDLWAVGFFQAGMTIETLPVISHYDGTRWRIVKSPQPSASALTAIGGASARDIWAAGRQFHHGRLLTIVEHYNGHRWTRVASPEPPSTDYLELNAIAAISHRNVWAAGNYHDAAGVSRTLVLHYDGTAWTRVPSTNLGTGDNYLTGLTVLRGQPWAVGRAEDGKHSRASAMRWNGTRWKSQFLPRVGSGDASLYAVVTGADGTLWAVGSKTDAAGVRRTLTMHRHAGVWQVVPSPNLGTKDNVLYGVTITPNHELWAVGKATSKALSLRRAA